MKVQYQLQGTYHRLHVKIANTASTSLVDLMQAVQAVATQTRRRSLPLIQQFGLQFLPESVLVNLLQQAQGVRSESELYQLPSLKLLHLNKSNVLVAANTYRYQFTCSEWTLDLFPDHPQLPVWQSNDEAQLGTYTLILESPHYPGIPSEFSANIWQQGVKHLSDLTEIQKIHAALKSLNPTLFCLTAPQIPQLQVWIDSQDLSIDTRAAITFLRLGDHDLSTLSEKARELVLAYQNHHNLPHKKPLLLYPEATLPSTQRLAVGRKNRSLLKDIISQARQFLLISSYIIEDEELAALLAQKAQTLPQGVWILTDLRNEIVDRIDARTTNISTPEEYQRTDERKKACLRMLLNANVAIRSGAFHLKTYISEQCAYLGSCNLTKGSLDFNLESGVVFQNNSVHHQLINSFQHYWQQRSRDEVIPISNFDGFQLRSINHHSSLKQQNSLNLLTPSQYKEDLLNQLIGFTGSIQIYTRSFFPSIEIEQFLNLLDTRVYVDSQFTKISSKVRVKGIHSLHAKITLLDDIAYIGGINFNFHSSAFSLTDLMYKTTNPQEIKQIKQVIHSLY